jgi:hypothetical protein
MTSMPRRPLDVVSTVLHIYDIYDMRGYTTRCQPRHSEHREPAHVAAVAAGHDVTDGASVTCAATPVPKLAHDSILFTIFNVSLLHPPASAHPRQQAEASTSVALALDEPHSATPEALPPSPRFAASSAHRPACQRRSRAPASARSHGVLHENGE